MVTAVTNWGRSGLHDWLIQRFTAIVLAAYTLFLVGFIICHPNLTYAEWSGLFGTLWMRVFSLLALVSTVAHGWIGLWGVLTDYITTRMVGGSALFLRMTAMLIYVLICVTFVVWGVEIIWGLS
ncbi:succinate dehydrogenase, hydrophobic membrane anchor protein [Teredinibacter waterburyi]|jgi:succinate dehydrogenase subunit D (EC 1.3.5.1)|uniref:succinate dehydrogenase, hydrophobic membrane anchor protein n=1 Tax=Teredinibacter waterburyi TaxID=1500538 RepID=UPI00165F95AC|nr:succinate dehydrogenase, hydrophobic membrane anchor protein [Teredinibacter waterburyi]